MRAVIDACVLYPTVLREIVLAVAETGALEPIWSDRLLEEWRRAARRTHPEQEAALAGEIALVRAAWPDAGLAADDALEATLSLPDENDRHVLATAIRGEAACILTLNLRDFPARTLARYSVMPQHPDTLLLSLWEEDPDRIGGIIEPIARRVVALSSEELSLRSALKRARLPRLGKALQRAGALDTL